MNKETLYKQTYRITHKEKNKVIKASIEEGSENKVIRRLINENL